MTSLTFTIMIILILLGVPVAYSILGAGTLFLIISSMKPLLLIPQRMTTGLDSFPLLAVPLFIFVGELMDRGGISRRMVNWAESLLGWIPGGLGIVTIASCAMFAALTGSGPATVAAIGSIMIPSLSFASPNSASEHNIPNDSTSLILLFFILKFPGKTAPILATTTLSFNL